MKGLQILSSPKELKLLGNENAYTILNMLRKQEYSGIEIAEETGMDSGLAYYYLRKLEKHGLIEIIRTEKRRGATEKFYRATAENFLIHADIGKSSDEITMSMSNAYLDTIQYKRMNMLINESIDHIVNEHLRITKGSKIYISFFKNNIEFLERLVSCILHIGAECRYYLCSPLLTEQMWSTLPISSIESFYGYASDEFKWADVWINLGIPPMLDMTGIPPDRIDKIAEIRGRTLPGLRMNKGMRTMEVNLLSFEEDFQNDPKVFERMEMYWKATALKMDDYSKMKEIASNLLSRREFKIKSGQHAELQVKFSSDHYVLHAGPVSDFYTGHEHYTMPSGTIEILPETAGINGDIYCELIADAETRISGVRLRIENNIVIDAKADKGLDILQSRLDSHGIEGRTVSQVSFGLNSQINNAKLLPEIAYITCGTVNISLGSNTHLGGAITDNIPYWELNSLSPTVFSGDELILKNNKFRIP